jgi:hypothetical protein
MNLKNRQIYNKNKYENGNGNDIFEKSNELNLNNIDLSKNEIKEKNINKNIFLDKNKINSFKNNIINKNKKLFLNNKYDNNYSCKNINIHSNTPNQSTIYLEKVKEDIKNFKNKNDLNKKSEKNIKSENNRKIFIYKKYDEGFIMPVNTIEKIIKINN